MLDEIFEKLEGKSFDEYVSSLNGAELKDFLIFINSKVRDIEPEEGGLFQDEGRYLENGEYQEYRMNVGGGQLIAPRKVVQDASFEKMSSMLKNVKDSRYKAIVMYTLINYLHLFRDGNGRTSRLVYDLLLGKLEGKQDEKYYTHEKGEESGLGGPWHEARKVQQPQAMSTLASQFLMKYLLNEGLISSVHEDLSKHVYIQTQCMDNMVYINNKKNQLSKRTLEHVKKALKDNNEVISTSALSILIMLTKKGNVQPLKNYFFNREWEGEYEDGLIRNSINISASKDSEYVEIFGKLPRDASAETFKDWNPEDYLNLVDLADKLKECLIDLVIDFAERPESFIFDQNEGKDITVMDALMGDDVLGGNKNLIKVYHAPFSEDKQCRVYGSISQIRSIIDRPRTCDEEKFLIDTYEKCGIKSTDLSNARKMIEGTLEKKKQKHINIQKDSEEIEWLG